MISELLITVSMANEKLTLTWHSYASHFREVLANLLDTGKSSDVTLVCDDQVKFKAHKLNLKIFSPVFESILNEKKNSSQLCIKNFSFESRMDKRLPEKWGRLTNQRN